MSKFRCEYRYTRPYGTPRHCWTCVGAKGATHLHIAGPYRDDDSHSYTCGIEVHHRSPPPYMRDEAPTQDNCFVLNAPCWSDGSSLRAEEAYLPIWQADPHNHDKIFQLLKDEYMRVFEEDAKFLEGQSND